MLHVIIIKFLTQVKKGQIRRLLSEAVAYESEQGQAALPTWENTALPCNIQMVSFAYLPCHVTISTFQFYPSTCEQAFHESVPLTFDCTSHTLR